MPPLNQACVKTWDIYLEGYELKRWDVTNCPLNPFINYASFIMCFNDYYKRLEDWAKNDVSPASRFIKNNEGLHVDVYKHEDMEEWLPNLESKVGASFTR